MQVDSDGWRWREMDGESHVDGWCMMQDCLDHGGAGPDGVVTTCERVGMSLKLMWRDACEVQTEHIAGCVGWCV